MRRILLVINLVITELFAAGETISAAEISQPNFEIKRPQLEIDQLKLKGILQLTSLTLDKSQVVAGSSDSVVTATVGINVPAPANGATVQFSVSPFHAEAGALALPEVSSVTIPQGRTSATVRIRTVANPVYASPTVCTLTASLGGSRRTVNFTVERIRIISMILLPATGFGGFTANGTLTLSAAPVAGTTVALISDHPDVVRFGTTGNAQSSANLSFDGKSGAIKTFSIVVSSVPQPTTVAIRAKLFKQEVVSQISVK